MPTSDPSAIDPVEDRAPGLRMLAERAQTNLGKEDAGIERFNAAARNAALPGVGKAGSTPETDAQNMGIANAMNRADDARVGAAAQPAPTSPVDAVADAYGQQREGLESQKKVLMARLGIIKPAEAGLAAVVMAPPSQHGELIKQWDLLEKQSNNLLREHHYAATESARMAHENFAREEHIAGATDFADFASAITALRKKGVKEGTPEYESAMMEIISNHPRGVSTAAGRTLAGAAIKQHEDSATRRNNFEVYRTAGKLGVDPQQDENGKFSIEATVAHAREKGVNVDTVLKTGDKPTAPYKDSEKDLAKLGITPEQFLSRDKNHDRATTSDQPSNKSDIETKRKADGSNIAFDVGGRTILMPKDDFERHKAVLEPPTAKDATTATASSGTTAAAGAAKKHLGTYNPKTGNFE